MGFRGEFHARAGAILKDECEEYEPDPDDDDLEDTFDSHSEESVDGVDVSS